MSLKDPKKQIALSEKIVKDDLSVREVELIVSGKENHVDPLKAPMGIKLAHTLIKSPQILDLEDKLRRIVGTRVSIMEKNGKGKITIEFSNNAQFRKYFSKVKGLDRVALAIIFKKRF